MLVQFTLATFLLIIKILVLHTSFWLLEFILLFLGSEILSYPIGAFSYLVLFSDCFGSSFEYELDELCFIVHIFNSMFYAHPANFVLYMVSFVSMMILSISPRSLGLVESTCKVSYRLIILYSSFAIHFSYTTNGFFVSLLFIVVVWWLVLSEASYFDGWLGFTMSVNLNWANIAVYSISVLIWVALFILINSYTVTPLNAAIFRIPSLTAFQGQPLYTEGSLDYNIHVNPYTGGVSSNYWDTIDGVPCNKIVTLSPRNWVYYENTTVTINNSVDNTVKFVGVCINNNHLLPPIVETKTASAYDRLFVLPNEHDGTKLVVSKQPQRVSLFCDCTNVPRKWALPIASSEYSDYVNFSPSSNSFSLDLFSLGLYDVHSLHPISVVNHPSMHAYECGECEYWSKYAMKQCLYFWCPCSSSWNCSPYIAAPCMFCCYCPLCIFLSCWFCILP